MQKKRVTVLDIGSSGLRLYVAERGLNNTFLIMSEVKRDFGVYYDGEIIDLEEFIDNLKSAVSELEDKQRSKASKIYVGVPSDFLSTFCKLYELSYGKNKCVYDEDVEDLFNSSLAKQYDKYYLISRSAVYFTLSDGRRTHCPVGETTDKLGGLLTYFFCKIKFKKLVDEILKPMGVSEIEYCSPTLAESLYLFSDEERNNRNVIIDCGALSTSFSYCSGDGVLYEKSFPLGGDVIVGRLMEVFGGSEAAVFESLKRQANLSLKPLSNAVYEVTTSKRDYEFPVDKVNRVILETVDAIADSIGRCIEEGILDKSEDLVLYLTGGGIGYIRGAKEYLKEKLGYIVNIRAPQIPQMDKPVYSCPLSLIEFALKQEEATKKASLIAKLFRKI